MRGIDMGRRKLKPLVKNFILGGLLVLTGACTSFMTSGTSKQEVQISATYQGCLNDTSCKYMLEGGTVINGPSPSAGVEIGHKVTVTKVGQQVQMVSALPKHVKKHTTSEGVEVCMLESANGIHGGGGNFGSQTPMRPCTDEEVKGKYRPMEKLPTNFLDEY